MTGSPMNAAIRSAPTLAIVCSSSRRARRRRRRAAASASTGGRSPERQRPEALLQRRDPRGRERAVADAVVGHLRERIRCAPAGRCACHASRASLIAVSIPSEPPFVKKTWSSPRGASSARRAASSDRRLVREVPERRVELEPSPSARRPPRASSLRPWPTGALPEAAGAVDVLVAVDVPQARARAARPDDRGGRRADDRVRMDHVRGVELG
jgi:hypothetical protein